MACVFVVFVFCHGWNCLTSVSQLGLFVTRVVLFTSFDLLGSFDFDCGFVDIVDCGFVDLTLANG